MQPTLIREILDSEGKVVKPFEPKLKWDITKDPVIHVYDENNHPDRRDKNCRSLGGGDGQGRHARWWWKERRSAPWKTNWVWKAKGS